MSPAPDEHAFQGPPRAVDAYAAAGRQSTLASLDASLGYSTHVAGDLDPLWARWYDAIAQMPLENLSDDDVARILDSAMHLPVVLPLALQRLREASGVPDRLLLAVARAARRLKATLPARADETRRLLQELRVRGGGESAPPPEGSPWPAEPTLGEAVAAAQDELERNVPLESVWGWREPPSPMSRRPSAEELRRLSPDQGPAIRRPDEP